MKKGGSENNEILKWDNCRPISMATEGTTESSKWWKQRLCADNNGQWARSSRQHVIKSSACHAKGFGFRPEGFGELLKDFNPSSDTIQLALYYKSGWSDTNCQQPVLRRWRILLIKIYQI